MQQTRNHSRGQVWLGFCAPVLLSSCVTCVITELGEFRRLLKTQMFGFS